MRVSELLKRINRAFLKNQSEEEGSRMESSRIPERDSTLVRAAAVHLRTLVGASTIRRRSKAACSILLIDIKRGRF